MEGSRYSQLALSSLVFSVVSVIAAAVILAHLWFGGIYRPVIRLAMPVAALSSVVALVLGVIALVGKRGRSVFALVGVFLAAAVLAGFVILIDIGASSR